MSSIHTYLEAPGLHGMNTNDTEHIGTFLDWVEAVYGKPTREECGHRITELGDNTNFDPDILLGESYEQQSAERLRTVENMATIRTNSRYRLLDTAQGTP